MRGVTQAAWGSVLFFLVAPGVVAGLVPWSITRYANLAELPVAVLGLLVAALGLAALIACFVQFVREGRGTPASIAPTEDLVVGGLYRWVRNPMYLAVVAAITGQGLLLGQAVLFLHAAIMAAVFGAFVHGYEQPTLARQFGADYESYRRAVPGWWPRLRPWRGDG